MSTEDRDLAEGAGVTGSAAEPMPGAAAESGAEAGDPTVADVMERDVISVHPGTGVKELAEMMHERHVGGAPVIDDDGRLVGIVTDGDLIAEDADIHAPAQIDIFGAIVYLGSFHKYEERLRRAVGATVGEVMTTKVHTVHPDDSVRRAATLMRDHKINRVPVIDDEGRLVGLVTRTDIVHSLGL
jgi:CBS domain-containing protein